VWSEGYYFPRFPQPQQIYVISVETGLENWWNDPHQPNWRANQFDDVLAALTLVSMQGIINRSDPAVYLDWQDSGKQRNAAHFWLTPLADHVDLVQTGVEGTDAVEFLWKIFSPRFRGAVMYEPDLPDTINLATMLAGLEDRLMIAPDQLEVPAISAILNELEGACDPDADSLGLPTLSESPCTIDLRLLAEQQGWREPSDDWDLLSESRHRIYQWVYDNLWPRLEKRAIGMISPGAPSSRWLGDTQVFDPLGLACRDYLVALRLPALWLSTVDEPESTLLAQFLQDAPSPIPLFSFYDGDEQGSVALASRHGDWVPVIPNANTPLSAGNLTVLSAIDEPVQPFQARLDDDRLFAALGNLPIVTLWSSDGDSIQILMDRGVHGGPDFYWEEVRGSAFGWTINPTLASLSPLAWNYYVETAEGTSFVVGLSGAGYAYPALMSDSQLEDYVEYTARYLDLTGVRTLFVDEGSGEFDEHLGRLYYTHLGPAGYLGAFSVGASQRAGNYSYPGVPAPLVQEAYLLTPGAGASILQSLLTAEPGMVSLDFPVAHSEGKPIPDPSAFGEQAARFSRPDLANCCMVIAGPRLILAPGTYTATYRLKVENNQSRLPFAHLVLLQQVGEGRSLVDRTLSPSDFQAGEWQDFSLSLTLDEFVSDVEVWLDYMGGTPGNADTDLYADTIALRREGGPALPFVVPIFIGLVGPVEPLNEDLRLVTEELERQGGVLLTPDELMAALNPEYMIGWAASMLGSDDPALAEAQLLMEDGQFLKSLYAVREALRAFPERTYTSSDGNVIVQANAWVTDLQLDQQAGSLLFNTHASPLAEVHIKLQLPMKLLGEAPTVTVDGVSVAARISSDGTARLVEFELAGGPHEVQVTKR